MSKQKKTRLKYHTKLTQSVIDAISEAIFIGLTEEEAAQNSGITAKQYHQWKEAGDAELAKLADDPTFEPGIHGRLAQSIINSRLFPKTCYLQAMIQCVEEPEMNDRLARVTAAAWLLDHLAKIDK